jgi:threonine dehydratase
MSVKISDIHAARNILRDVLIHTPILADNKLSEQTGAKIFLKAESLQRGGSFKVRGAYNKISRLSAEEKSRGVIAASAGNHAQGVALAASLVGVKSTIVLPEFAPLTKIIATRNFGGEVILKGKSFDEAVAYSRQVQEEKGFTYVHAFDDELIIAGQGTCGLEIVEEKPEVTLIVVPIGGGGLMSGIAIAAKALNPQIRLVGVQAAGCGAVNQSLLAGKPVMFENAATIADGIAVKKPGELTLPIIQELIDEVVEVTEDEIARGIAHSVQSMRLVVEGAGAAGVAALLAGKIKIAENDTVCAVLCGGNIDGNLLARVLEHVMVKQGRYILLKLTVLDRPGGIAPLLDAVADAGANVVEIFHRRAIWLAPLGKVGIELILEVRDEQHGQEVQKHLDSVGYHVKRVGQGDWAD